MADVYVNKIGNVMVVTPLRSGRLQGLAEYKKVIFYSEKKEQVEALTRWIFADLDKGTLLDEWGNRYDHQVHTLLSGTLDQGQQFLEVLSEMGCIVSEQTDLFVPFQKIDLHSQESSDALRQHHPRAFTLARPGRKSIAALVTNIRDALMIGKS